MAQLDSLDPLDRRAARFPENPNRNEDPMIRVPRMRDDRDLPLDRDQPGTNFPNAITPDIAFQLVGDGAPFDMDPNSPSMVALNGTLRRQFGPTTAARGELRQEVLDPLGLKYITTVGIWLQPRPLTTALTDAMDRGLKGLQLRGGRRTLGFYVNATFVQRTVATAFFRLGPTLDDLGQSSWNGHIHLLGHRVSFQAPDVVVMTINGFDSRLIVSVDFEVRITDTFNIDATRRVRVVSNTTTTAVSPELANALGSLILGPLGTILSTIFHEINVPVDASKIVSPGMTIANAFRPRIFLGPLRLDLLYTKVGVNSGGVTAEGAWGLAIRQPAVIINGPNQIAIEETDFFWEKYILVLTDIDTTPSGNFGQVWTNVGYLTKPLVPPIIVEVNFDVRGAIAGQVVQRELSVTVFGVDGVAAVGTLQVNIHINAPVTDENVDKVDAKCFKKPWNCE